MAKKIDSKVSGWRALSLRQPWAWIVLHASAHRDPDYVEEALRFVEARFGKDLVEEYREEEDLVARGGYLGVCRVVGRISATDRAGVFDVDCFRLPEDGAPLRGTVLGDLLTVEDLDTGDAADWDLRWWMREQHGLLLKDVEALQFVPAPGSLGLMRVAPEHVRALGLPPTPEEWLRGRD